MVIIFLGILILCSSIELLNNTSKKYVYAVLFLILAVMEGSRWGSGVDFDMYWKSYKNVLDTVPNMHNARFDPFYLFLSKGFKLFNIHFSVFLLFISIFCAFLYYQTFKKLTTYPITALLFFFVSIIGLWGNIRQEIALAVVFFGLPYLLNKNYIIYYLLVLLASGFHFTAIIMIFFPLLNNSISLKKWNLIIMLSLILILLPAEQIALYLFKKIEIIVPIFYQKFLFYKDFNITNFNFLQIALGTIKKLIPVLFLHFFRSKLQDRLGYSFLFNISIFSLLFYWWANLNFIYFLGRYTIYFSLYEVIIYSWIGLVIKDIELKKRAAVLLIFYLFSLLVFIKSITLYPKLFFPYKTIFSL